MRALPDQAPSPKLFFLFFHSTFVHYCHPLHWTGSFCDTGITCNSSLWPYTLILGLLWSRWIRSICWKQCYLVLVWLFGAASFKIMIVYQMKCGFLRQKLLKNHSMILLMWLQKLRMCFDFLCFRIKKNSSDSLLAASLTLPMLHPVLGGNSFLWASQWLFFIFWTSRENCSLHFVHQYKSESQFNNWNGVSFQYSNWANV